MNKVIFQNIFRFIGLALLQVLVLNHIDLFGYLNPMVYIMWVLLFPIRKNKSALLIFSFLLGLSIDIFSDSGGINAAAAVFIAYVRLPVLKAVLRKTDFDFVLFNIRSIAFSKSLLFIGILIGIHHFIVFSLEYFSFRNLITIFTTTIFTSIFTIIVSILGMFIFTSKK